MNAYMYLYICAQVKRMAVNMKTREHGSTGAKAPVNWKGSRKLKRREPLWLLCLSDQQNSIDHHSLTMQFDTYMRV